MNDIVQRLRDLPYRPMVNYGNGDVRDELDPDIVDAINEIQRLREISATLVEQMIEQRPWKDKRWSRCALAIAARAIRRGRHLTEEEKFENLMRAMADEEQP